MRNEDAARHAPWALATTRWASAEPDARLHEDGAPNAAPECPGSQPARGGHVSAGLNGAAAPTTRADTGGGERQKAQRRILPWVIFSAVRL